MKGIIWKSSFLWNLKDLGTLEHLGLYNPLCSRWKSLVPLEAKLECHPSVWKVGGPHSQVPLSINVQKHGQSMNFVPQVIVRKLWSLHSKFFFNLLKFNFKQPQMANELFNFHWGFPRIILNRIFKIFYSTENQAGGHLSLFVAEMSVVTVQCFCSSVPCLIHELLPRVHPPWFILLCSSHHLRSCQLPNSLIHSEPWSPLIMEPIPWKLSLTSFSKGYYLISQPLHSIHTPGVTISLSLSFYKVKNVFLWEIDPAKNPQGKEIQKTGLFRENTSSEMLFMEASTRKVSPEGAIHCRTNRPFFPEENTAMQRCYVVKVCR